MRQAAIEDLSAGVTGRHESLFAADVAARDAELRERVTGRRVLVIGGAGSIGSSTVRALARLAPAALHVVDHNENGLTELVRDLRSGHADLPVPDFRTLPIDFGAPVMFRLLDDQRPYDFVLNFAALKHVRSEKDLYSLLQMFDTNVVKASRLLRWLSTRGYGGRYFSVSTDKAANPVNLMGASKRVMEHVTLSSELYPRAAFSATSARFANVAFSDGSLLQGFLQRLQKRQPLAAPARTRRFFISLEEAGHICLLAAVCAPDRKIVIPRLDPAADLLELESVATTVLAGHDLRPRHYTSDAAARAAVEADLATGQYPLVLTPLDTDGEKPYEEFVGDGERTSEIGMQALLAVDYSPAPEAALRTLVATLEGMALAAETDASVAGIVHGVETVVPQFRHVATGKSLDARM